jgi:hypothetical protein
MKKADLSAKDQSLKAKIEEFGSLEERMKKMSDERREFEGLNQYLQERDAQMESIIISK